MTFNRPHLMLLLALLAGSGFNTSAAAGTPPAAVQAGDMAPDFSVPVAGQNLRLQDLRGHVVYLDFWASWCGPCQRSFPWMRAMHAKYQAQGLYILAINVDEHPEEAQRFLTKFPAPFAVGWDTQGTVAQRYGVQVMPSSLIVDAQGRVLARHLGFRPEHATTLEQTLTQALANAASAAPISPPPANAHPPEAAPK